MTMTKDEWRRIDKQIRDLRELAARTESVEEARTAAYAIWKIVQKHDLIIIEPGVMSELMAKELGQFTTRRRGRR